MSNVVERTINILKERKAKLESGEINCIPLPWERFRQELPGIEQGTYLLVSGGTKSGKSQLTNYLVVYNSILFAYKHPEQIRVKFFYYNLEETAESITLRFISYLLYNLSKGKIRVSPTDLKSTNAEKPISQEVLDILETEEYKKILQFYDECVEFMPDRNATGMYIPIKRFFESNGKVFTKTKKFTNDIGEIQEYQGFDYYIPNDPNLYTFVIVDHVSLIESERGMDLRQSINKLSEYMVLLRNRYNAIPVVIQQQNIESTGLEAFKANRIRPTAVGTADSKAPSKDASLMLGISNPYSFEMDSYKGYDLTKLKNYFRVMEVVLNRNGSTGGLCPLFMDGATNTFFELPKPNDTEALPKWYELVNRNEDAKKLKPSILNILKSINFKLFKN